MKILTLNYEYPPIGGGGGVVSKDICEILAQKGHKVTVITMKYGSLPSYEKINGVHVVRVNCVRKSDSACYPWEQLTYIISACRYLKKHLRKHRYDVCHTHFIVPTGAVAVWLKWKYNLEYIVTAHGSDVPGHNNKKFKFLHFLLKKPWTYIVKNAAAVVSPSPYLKNLMSKNYRSYKYDMIPNGVRTELYQSAEKKKYILMLSRLQELKGIQNVIRAISKIDLDEWKLKIVGDGPYKENLQKLVQELKLEDKVEFLGWVENQSIEHLTLLSEAYLYISASYFENCPVSVLEAGCSGANLLLSDICAHHQLVGNEAVYFKPDDVNDLANKIKDILFEGKGKKVKKIREKDWAQIIVKYEDLFQKAIKKQGGQR